MSDDEFFRLSPRQLRLLRNRHREQTQHEELLAGILASVVANYSMAAPKKPATPDVFMPSQWHKRRVQAETTKGGRVSRSAIAGNIRCFLTARLDGDGAVQ